MKNKLLSFLQAVFGGKKKKDAGRDQNFAATDYIQHRLDLYMVEMRPFLQPHYTIKQLAGAIRIPAYQLSAMINKRKGMNFREYLNKLRIHYCEDLIRIEGGKKINLRELGLRCGFRNRNTFVHAFKKFTGFTPSEYVRQHS
jgi:YesN/AraC family two-component response regulator